MHTVHTKSRNSARCRTSNPVSLDPPPRPRVRKSNQTSIFDTRKTLTCCRSLGYSSIGWLLFRFISLLSKPKCYQTYWPKSRSFNIVRWLSGSHKPRCENVRYVSYRVFKLARSQRSPTAPWGRLRVRPPAPPHTVSQPRLLLHSPPRPNM